LASNLHNGRVCIVSDSLTVTFEVHTLKSGRWELNANYPPEESEKCLDAAKRLFASNRFEGVRVIEDTYDPSSKTHEEDVLYCSPRRPPPKPVRREAKAPRARRVKAAAKPATTKKPAKREPSEIVRGIPKIAVVSTVSLAVAALISYVVILVLQQLQRIDVAISSNMAQAVLIAVFLLTALGLFVPLMRRFGPSLRPAAKAAPEAPVTNPPAMPANLPQPPPLSAENPAPAEAGDDALADPSEPEFAAADEEPDPEPTEPDEVAPPDAPVPAAAEDVSADILKFIRDSLEPLAAAGRPLDAFNRFGLTLYFAGAGEYLGSRDGLPRETMRDILAAHVRMLGHTPEMAQGFCANIDEYLVNPKYFKMYEAGRGAIVRHLQDPDGDTGALAALDFWNEPAAPGVSHDKEFVAVLFTDIVGSTAITQERGDEAAQLVVHAHNAIVRDALALHGGREIKHTGDGIMATFPQITNAVDGAVAMQEACARVNAATPGLGLGLCIGVNAGEPIHEGGDIFGTPVQMAARVLSKAEGDEIAVSNIVREMCVGKSYAFAKKGDYDLKGFAEPVPVYLLEWQTGMTVPSAAE
jgi:adenylate cyclase